jgi:2-iminoacetate synthase ThiH
MLRAQALQDETAGFQAFIPLAFHPTTTRCASCRRRARPTVCACMRCRG